MRRLLTIIASICCLALAGQAAERDSLTVSLITCWPGPEIYELEGHEALRIRSSEGTDSVWNYGLFDFSEPNFVYRFVKGQTDYKLGAYPFAWFMPSYMAQNRRVVEQELALTQEEAHRLREILRLKALPQNARYRYKYLTDNCATRLLVNLDSAAQSPISYPDSVAFGTYRNAMRSYHSDYPWYQFGIDLALGSGIDRKISARDEMFAPVRLAEMARGARFSDGRPLVSGERVLFEGAEARLAPTPWWKAPLFWSWIVLFLSVGVCLIDLRRGKMFRPWYSLWFLLTGLAGLLVTFLVVVSTHEATSPNVLLFWLNPIGLLLAFCIWWRKLAAVEMILAGMNALATGLLLLVWAFQAQSANPAFFPLMAVSVILSITVIILERRLPAKKPAPARKRNQPRRK